MTTDDLVFFECKNQNPWEKTWKDYSDKTDFSDAEIGALMYSDITVEYTVTEDEVVIDDYNYETCEKYDETKDDYFKHEPTELEIKDFKDWLKDEIERKI